MTDPTFVLRVLDVVGSADMHDSLYWRTDGEFAPVAFFVNCSDLFAWACADAEPVTPDTLAELEQAFADVQAVDGSAIWGPSLYAARRRKLRPMRKAYPPNEALRALFDACGPERTAVQP